MDIYIWCRHKQHSSFVRMFTICIYMYRYNQSSQGQPLHSFRMLLLFRIEFSVQSWSVLVYSKPGFGSPSRLLLFQPLLNPGILPLRTQIKRENFPKVYNSILLQTFIKGPFGGYLMQVSQNSFSYCCLRFLICNRRLNVSQKSKSGLCVFKPENYTKVKFFKTIGHT